MSEMCSHEFKWVGRMQISANRWRVSGECLKCGRPGTATLTHHASGTVSMEDLLMDERAPMAYEGRSPRMVEVEGPPVEVDEVAALYLVRAAPEVVGLEIERECVAMTMLTGTPTILVGHTGIAKTLLLKRMHHELGWPYHTVAGHAQVEVDTLIGKIWVESGTMSFKPGVLIHCMRHGVAVGINEINAIAPEVNIMLHEYLDEGHVTIPDLPPSHPDFLIVPHPNFRLYGTMNPPEFYAGVKGLSAALQRRCIMRRVEPLGPDDEIKVIQGQVEDFDFETARRMVQVATGMRQNLDQNKCSFFLSTADLVMWADFAKRVGNIHKAAEIAVYGKAPREDVDLLKTVVQACIGADRRNGV